MRISTLDLFQRGLDGLLNNQKMLNDLQLKIASGKNILKPSDDPVGATRVLNLKQTEATIEQFLSNSNSAMGDLESQDSILKSVNNNYQRIRELATQAGNGSLNYSDRHAISLEIEQRLEELQALANSKNSDGEYMFSGSKGQTMAITQNNTGSYAYQGDEGQRFTKIGASMSMSMSDTAKEIFFTIPSDKILASTSSGQTSLTTSGSGLVASGGLSVLNQNELILNDVLIAPSVSDGVSSSDATGSALALANAINASTSNHGVTANAQPNIINLGTITAGVLGGGDFTLNGISITDATGSEATTLAALQSATPQTGVTVTQPGGTGTDIVLTAIDGRNIQLQTDGASVSNFANFDLNSGAANQVQRSSVTLRDHNNIIVGGSNPTDIGLTTGGVSSTANTGNGVMSTPVIVSTPPDVNETYSIIFNGGGTYDIVADSNPSIPLTGFDDVTYMSGQDIEFNGIRVNISGTPDAGDTFGVQLDVPAYQNAFESIKDLINTIQGTSDLGQLSYEIGVALSNIANAETRTLEVRAKVGARLNVIDSQIDVNESMKLLTAQSLSQVQDLDYTEAISQLSQRSSALEAAQASYVKVQSLTLFNFIR